VSDVTADALNSRLNPVGFPDPDLVIRLGCGDPAGDGCLLWQTAYSEFMFVSKSWPDFSEHDLDAAMDHFIQRERRFGGIRP
jgi:undecaprenyl diphosphate synthase